jgi:hypothetical protein
MGRKHPTGSWNNTGGAIPEEYQRVPAPVFVVNDRRSEDVDDEGKQKRRTPDLDAHMWGCWEKDGPGAKVRKEISSIKGRIAWFNGGTAVLSAIGLVILAAWLSQRFAAVERNAVKRTDVEYAMQKSAAMAVAKQGDDIMKQLQQAAADTAPAPVPMTTKARR